MNRDGKLVRDRIPEIIRASGKEPVTRTHLHDDEFRRRLHDKLQEEVGEFLRADRNGYPDELVDILEVVYAIADAHGIAREYLEKTRLARLEERGGFSDRIVWLGNKEKEEGET